nr:unnamed protein product [Trichobilharzia regenti]
MIDFRRTPCSSLWSAYDPRAFKLEGLSDDLENNVPSVCNTLLHALNKISVNQQSRESCPKLYDECHLNKPAAYLKQYSPSSNHISSGGGVLGSHVHTCNPITQARVHTGQPISQVRVSTQVSNNNYNSKLMAPSFYATPAPVYSSVSNPQPYSPNPGILNGTPPNVAPYICQEQYRVSRTTESSQFSDYLLLAKAFGAAVAILNMKPIKPPRHHQFPICSLRSKEWDKDTLKLHAW